MYRIVKPTKFHAEIARTTGYFLNKFNRMINWVKCTQISQRYKICGQRCCI